MASRTPSLQARSQYHAHWGEYATVEGLPNAPSNAIGGGSYVLQAGDQAFVTGLGTYTCYDAGTSGGGDAVWQAQTPLVREITGFTNLDYYATAAGAVPGSATMTVVALWRTKYAANGGLPTVMNNLVTPFGVPPGGGFAIGANNNQQKVYVCDAANLRENFTGATWPGTSGGHSGNDTSTGVLSYTAFTWSGSVLTVYVQGRQVATAGAISAGYIPSAGPLYVGYAPAPLAALEGGWLGGAVHQGLVATADQIYEHYLACRDALGVVDGGLNFEHLWDVKRLPFASAAPASIPDLGTLGTGTLTRTGAPTMRDRYPVYLTAGGAY